MKQKHYYSKGAQRLILILLCLIITPLLRAGSKPQDNRRTLTEVQKIQMKDIAVSWESACVKDGKTYYGFKLTLPYVTDNGKTNVKTSRIQLVDIAYKDKSNNTKVVTYPSINSKVKPNGTDAGILLRYAGMSDLTTMGFTSGNGATLELQRRNTTRLAYVADERIGIDMKVNHLYVDLLLLDNELGDNFRTLIDNGIKNFEIKLKIVQVNYEKTDETVTNEYTYPVTITETLLKEPSLTFNKFNNDGSLVYDYSNLNCQTGSKQTDNAFVTFILNMTSYQDNYLQTLRFLCNHYKSAYNESGYVRTNAIKGNAGSMEIDLVSYFTNNWTTGANLSKEYAVKYPTYASSSNELLKYALKKNLESGFGATIKNNLEFYISSNYNNRSVEKKATYTKEKIYEYNVGSGMAQAYDLTVAQVANDKKIKLTWKSPRGTNFRTNTATPFLIERSEDGITFNEIGRITYVGSTTATMYTYTFTDSIITEGVDYTYRLSRTPDNNVTNGWIKTSEIKRIKVDYTAIRPTDFSAYWTGSSIELNAMLDTSLIADATTKFYLKRRPIGENTWSEVLIDDNKQWRENHYYYLYDEGVASCQGYEYILVSEINKLKFETPSISIVTGNTYSTVSDLNASKGTYEDGVQLEFLLLQGSPNIYIERRIKGSQEYRQIGKLENLSASATRIQKWVDYNCSSEMYEYRLRMEDQCDNEEPVVSTTEPVIGFKSVYATVTGKVNYAGGSAVEGVQVNAIPASSKLLNRNAAFVQYENFSEGIPHVFFKEDMQLTSTPFTFQAWVGSTHFASGKGVETNVFGLFPLSLTCKSSVSSYTINLNAQKSQPSYAAEELPPTIYSCVINLKDAPRTDGKMYWDHISIVYDNAYLYFYYNGKLAKKTKITANTFCKDPECASSVIHFLGFPSATENTPENPAGIDEIRLWNRILSATEIEQNYNAFITGRETGLIGYWKFDEQDPRAFYDYSFSEGIANQNHGYLIANPDCNFTKEGPAWEQLASRAYTDQYGSYQIAGIPYQGEGSSYRIKPEKDVHRFSPAEDVVFFDQSNHVINGIKFEDISSFKVSGQVFYENTRFPVQDAIVSIDGYPAYSNGKIIQTNYYGEFTIDVPIGSHYISVEKSGHTFTNGGRFPAKEDSLFVFDRNLTLAEPFYESTRSRVIGRICGGLAEGNKELGFNQSKNNLGKLRLILQAEGKETFNLSAGEKPDTTIILHPKQKVQDITLAGAGDHIFKTVLISRPSLEAGKYEYEVIPDSVSGEYVVDLIPESFKTTQIIAGQTEDRSDYFMSEFQRVPINLINTNGNSRQYFKLPTGDSTFVYNSQTGLNEKVAVNDSVYYCGISQKYIRRNQPEITVAQKEMTDGLFGEITTPFYNQVKKQQDTIQVIRDGKYVINNLPVFMQGEGYAFEIGLQEEYIYPSVNQSGQPIELSDIVPVSDGVLNIFNNLAVDVNETLAVDSITGKVTYEFVGGTSSLSIDPVRINSHIKTMNISAVSGGGMVQTSWKQEGDPFKGYLLGGAISGQNFTTRGPKSILTVLRDPPGSNSSSSFSKGYIKTTSKGSLSGAGHDLDEQLDGIFGAKMGTAKGLGLALITDDIDNDNRIGGGITSSSRHSSGDLTVTETSWDITYATSGEPAFVGAPNDLLIGESSNIVYSEATSLRVYPANNLPDGIINESIIDIGNNLVLAQRLAIDYTKEFDTHFIYTVNGIESKIIPDLIKMRNQLILLKGTSVNKATLKAKAYVSKVDADDENFGKSTAYYTIYEPTDKDANTIDSIQAFNNEIKSWEKVLADNESDKWKAYQNGGGKNISFSSGASYTYRSGGGNGTSHINESEWEVSPKFHTTVVFKAFNIGFQEELTVSEVNAGSSVDNWDDMTSDAYEYILQDDDAYDFHSVDVYKSPSGWGPVFRNRGGQTSCPFEGPVYAKYYQPNSYLVLSEGTAQLDKPKLSIVQSERNGVPGNRAALFDLILENESEANVDMVFILKVNEQTNPDGAILSIDGLPIGNGREIVIPAKTKVYKTLSLGRTKEDITQYPNIEIQLQSACQFNVDLIDDIYSSSLVSATFVPSCGNIAINNSINNTIMNQAQMDINSQIPGAYKGILPIKVESYDINSNVLKEVQILQKGSTDSDQQWNRIARYVKKGSGALPADALELPEGGFTHNWDMQNMLDRTYQIKSVALTSQGADGPVSQSEIITVIKNTKSPQVFGTPQPGSGILGVGDDISIAYDKEIEQALIDIPTHGDIAVTGMLNAAKVDHNAGLSFNGDKEFVVIPSNINLSYTPFTIEWMMKRNRMSTKEVILTHGSDNQTLEVGFTATNQIYAKINGSQVVSSAFTKSELQDNWGIYRILYNGNKLSINFNNQLVTVPLSVPEYLGVSPVIIGKDANGKNPFKGQLHDLRIWKKHIPEGSNTAEILTGKEANLIGYWPFTEAMGTVGEDKAMNRHASVSSSWFVDPLGKAVTLNGTSQYVSVPIGKYNLLSETSFSVEMWFKGTKPAANATLIANGKPDVSERFNIFLDKEGHVNLTVGGESVTAEGNVTDNLWHHLALVVDPFASATIYIDGETKAYMKGSAFGGITGSTMSLGACLVYDAGLNKTTPEGFFKGTVDEFRFWRTDISKSQIKANLMTKLKGNEAGLMAYYPFDTYNPEKTLLVGSYLNVTDKEQKEQAALAGSATYNNEGVAMKAPLPVSSVPFSWALNKDKIVISLRADKTNLQSYEGCNLTVAVNRLFDKYGNQAEVKSWNIFVDRKEVRWKDNNIDLAMNADKALVFETTIENKGAVTKEFSIANLPSWLSATPSSGTLLPQGSTKISFTIAPGLNIGRYEQSVQLNDAIYTNDVVYSDVMHLNLKVGVEAPDWKVNPADFEYSMNIFGELHIQGVPSTDIEDMVAVFDGEKCIGIAHPEYVTRYDRYFLFMKVYSNSTTVKNLNFRIWDASTGGLYAAKISETITFAPQQIYGTTTNPVIFDTQNEKYQRIELNKGWNWISFNVNNTKLKVPNNILGGLPNSDGDVIKSDNQGFDVYSPEDGWKGKLTDNGGFTNLAMYMLKSAQGTELNVPGTEIKASVTPITVKGNGYWNYISYLPAVNMAVNEAMVNYNAQTDDLLKSQSEFAIYDATAGWIGDLTYMKPGAGYILRRNASANTQFSYPDVSASLRSQVASSDEPSGILENRLYSDNMSIIATNEEGFMQAGDVLQAFIGTELHGESHTVIHKDEALEFITVSGDVQTNEPVYFKLIRNDEIVATSVNSTHFTRNTLVGSLDEPFVVRFLETGDIQVNTYPNPFVDHITIDVMAPDGKEVIANIFDMSGRSIGILSDVSVNGRCRLQWKSISSSIKMDAGIYLMKIQVGDETVIRKIKRN